MSTVDECCATLLEIKVKRMLELQTDKVDGSLTFIRPKLNQYFEVKRRICSF
jgi:hypothetical protein